MCSVGLERLAYLLVAYSLGASASSALGLLGLWLPRPVPLVAGAGLHLLLTLSLFFWAPKPRTLQHIWILYTVAVLWGVGSALNKTGISSEYSRGLWVAGQGIQGLLGGSCGKHRHPRDRLRGNGHPGGLSWGLCTCWGQVGIPMLRGGSPWTLQGQMGAVDTLKAGIESPAWTSCQLPGQAWDSG